MKYLFTKRIQYKLANLKIYGVKVTKRLILATIKFPEDINSTEDYPNLIASGKLDDSRVLRVVYRVERKNIVVITYYPARKGRYY